VIVRFKYAPNRAFEVVAPMEIYRLIGRRPSAVWVDDAQTAVPAGSGRYRLSELVYWRTRAEPGDQIHEHDRGLFLMTSDDACHPISLTPPTALEAVTAFTHAQAVLTADMTAIERAVAEGAMAQVKPRRPPRPPLRPVDRVLADSHPLVVEVAPSDEPEIKVVAGGRR
jgi:hypothetical protein